MPKIVYANAIISLLSSEEEHWKKITARTEVRFAQKNGVVVRRIASPNTILLQARRLLQNSLRRVAVHYHPVFDSIILDSKNTLFAAYKDETLLSFIVISDQESSILKGRSAYLQLSATDNVYKKLCPNYLLIWEATKFLRERNYSYFNLGLLTYQKCPDPDLESVAFFKRKWAVEEIIQTESVSALKYLYLRFFKRYFLVKQVVFFSQKVFGFFVSTTA